MLSGIAEMRASVDFVAKSVDQSRAISRHELARIHEALKLDFERMFNAASHRTLNEVMDQLGELLMTLQKEIMPDAKASGMNHEVSARLENALQKLSVLCLESRVRQSG